MISEQFKEIYKKALKFAIIHKHEYLTIEHIFLISLDYDEVKKILKKCNLDSEKFKNKLRNYLRKNLDELDKDIDDIDPMETIALTKTLERMLINSRNAEKPQTDLNDLISSILDDETSYTYLLFKDVGIDRVDILDILSDMKREEFLKKEKTILDEFTINLSQLAQEGNLDPVIAREDEIEKAIQILCRRKKNNPILIGEAGVGKTSILEGLTLAIENGIVPEVLKNHQILSLNITLLLSGSRFRGDLEKRLDDLFKEIEKRENIILFIDEIHTIIGAGASNGGGLDISNMLKPLLLTGKLRCIGATTYSEFKKFFGKDKALVRRFSKIDIKEPSLENSLKILQGLKSRYEEYHKVSYRDSALKSAVDLSAKYINDRFLPDKAIDLIDEVGASFQLLKKKRKIVTTRDIEDMIAKIVNIPSENVADDTKVLLKKLKDKLESRIFGQDKAIEELVIHIKQSQAGLKDDNKPIGSFLFTGPTGVGKTELVKELAKQMGIHFERFDMSEYMEKHSVAKLIGSPAGYVGYEDGGILTETIKKHPYTVLLLDEIEKANQEILNVLLQIMDNASLSDSSGSKISFKNIILVMTSNIGATEKQVGFNKNSNYKEDRAVKNYFSPEFINRLDSIIYFKPLIKENVIQIVDKFINDLENKLKDKKITISITQKAKEYLADKGFNEEMGARPLKRLINKEIKIPLTDEILFGKLINGGKVKITMKSDKLSISY